MQSDADFWLRAGVDKADFYAKAIFLSRKRETQPRSPELSQCLETSSETKAFLDHLADCFAYQKDGDHVSATAMTVDQKHITISVAKNNGFLKEDRTQDPKDIKFADHLFAWFNSLASSSIEHVDFSSHPAHSSPIWETLVLINKPRLSVWIKKLRNLAKANFMTTFRSVCTLVLGSSYPAGFKNWEAATDDITALYKAVQQRGPDAECVILAWECRHNTIICDLRKAIESEKPKISRMKGESKDAVRDVLSFIRYSDRLGRLRSAYSHLGSYCQDHHSGHTFAYRLIDSIDGMLPAASVPQARYLLEDDNLKLESKCHFHCEMQLLRHFLQPNQKSCQDYFGCSKRSCWLCWQILSLFEYTTKGTHSRIYYRWAFSFENDKLTSEQVVNAIKWVYFELENRCRLVQQNAEYHKVSPNPQTSARLTGQWPGTCDMRRRSTRDWQSDHMHYDVDGWHKRCVVRVMVYPNDGSDYYLRGVAAYEADTSRSIEQSDSGSSVSSSSSLLSLPPASDSQLLRHDLYLAFQFPSWLQNGQLWKYRCFMKEGSEWCQLLWYNPRSQDPINTWMSRWFANYTHELNTIRGDVYIVPARRCSDRGQFVIAIDPVKPSDVELRQLKLTVRQMRPTQLEETAVTAQVDQPGHGFAVHSGLFLKESTN